MGTGVLAGYPVVDIKATLTFWFVSRRRLISEMAFRDGGNIRLQGRGAQGRPGYSGTGDARGSGDPGRVRR